MSNETNNSSINVKTFTPKDPKNKYKLITIENLELNLSKKIKINSPRSLKAIYECNYQPQDLNFISFTEFKRKHPETLALPLEFQEKRYELYENNRRIKIQEVKEIRDLYIKNQEQKTHLLNRSNSFNNLTSNCSSNNETKTISNKHFQNKITTDEKLFEKMKVQKEKELIHMVEFQLQRKILQNETENNFLKQEHKRKLNELELKEKQANEEKKQLLKLQQRKLKDIELEMKRIEDEEIRNQKKIEKEQKELERQKERNEKHFIQEQKRIYFNKKVKQIQLNYEKKKERKQKNYELKNEQRFKSLEQQNIYKINENNKKIEAKQQLIQKNQKQLEDNLQQMQEHYIQQIQLNEFRRKNFEQKRQDKVEQNKEKAKLKEIHMQSVKIINHKKEQERSKQYKNKQNEIDKRTKEIEIQRQKEQETKIKEQLQHEKDLQKKLHHKKKEDQLIKNKILENIEEKNELIKQQKEKNQFDHLLKTEEMKYKQLIMNEKIQLLEKDQETQRDKLYQEIINKNAKVDKFLKEKEKHAANKQKLRKETVRTKEQYLKEFKQIFNKKQLDKDFFIKLKKFFPDNKDIDKIIEYFQGRITQQSTVQQKLQKMNEFNRPQRHIVINHIQCTTSNESPWNVTSEDGNYQKGDDVQNETNDKEEQRGKLTQKQIQELSIKYRTELNEKLLLLIAYEKQKEDYREKMVNNLKNKVPKELIENYYNKELAEVTSLLVSQNEEIQRKVSIYEKQLQLENQ